MAITTEQRDKLLDSILSILLERGLKATTMDSVAEKLQMSKRTLYELFNGKKEMIIACMGRHQEQMRAHNSEIMSQAPDAMTGLLRIFMSMRKMMERANADFFKDMDNLFPDAGKKYRKQHQESGRQMKQLFERGVSEGVFRTDVNFPVVFRMFQLQMESLKRMEEIVENQFTLVEVYDAVSISFLRSIATPKGMYILDNLGQQ